MDRLSQQSIWLKWQSVAERYVCCGFCCDKCYDCAEFDHLSSLFVDWSPHCGCEFLAYDLWSWLLFFSIFLFLLVKCLSSLTLFWFCCYCICLIAIRYVNALLFCVCLFSSSSSFSLQYSNGFTWKIATVITLEFYRLLIYMNKRFLRIAL